MKTIFSQFFYFFLLSGLLCIGCSAQNEPLPEIVVNEPTDTTTYKLVWQDNFDGNTLNETANWVIEVNGDGGGNNEMQYYRRENISVGVEPVTGANCLVITAKKENYNGKVCTSGRLKTLGKMSFKHGKIVARVKLPHTANGLWPAFWMMGADYPNVGWPKCGEIDILEMGHSNGIKNGTQDRYFNSWFHWGESWNGGSYPNWGKNYTNPTGIQDGFVLFTLIWDENSLKTYYGTDDDPLKVNIVEMAINGADVAGNAARYFHKPFFVIFNLAIGGNFTGITGSTNIGKITALNAENNYEAKMYVDYVRVYQLGVKNEVYNGPALNTGVSNPQSSTRFKLYPNPADNIIHIRGESIPARIVVVDVAGREVFTAVNTADVALGNLPAGNYLLHITDPQGKVETQHFVRK